MKLIFSLCLFLILAGIVRSSAQELPYFVTYSQQMEEPGNLDIEFFSAAGSPPTQMPFWVPTSNSNMA